MSACLGGLARAGFANDDNDLVLPDHLEEVLAAFIHRQQLPLVLDAVLLRKLTHLNRHEHALIVELNSLGRVPTTLEGWVQPWGVRVGVSPRPRVEPYTHVCHEYKVRDGYGVELHQYDRWCGSVRIQWHCQTP